MEILASFLLKKRKYVYIKCRFTAVYQHINNITPTSVLVCLQILEKWKFFAFFAWKNGIFRFSLPQGDTEAMLKRKIDLSGLT